MKHVVIIFAVVIVVLLAVLAFVPAKRSEAPTNPPAVAGPSPAVLVISDDGNVRVASVRPNDIIKSPLIIEGEARLWYFEASFPVWVLDGDGTELGVGIAQAQGDWMTTDFVSFKATVEFDAPKSSSGALLLQKDNPSGLPEYAEELRMPVRFQ